MNLVLPILTFFSILLQLSKQITLFAALLITVEFLVFHGFQLKLQKLSTFLEVLTVLTAPALTSRF